MSEPEVLVLGAGPAGLTAAHELQRHRRRVTVLEADPGMVGGIARTIMHQGYRFNIGGHRFFSKNPEIEDLWTELLGDEMLTRDRLSRIFYRGRYFRYPLQVANSLLQLGPLETVRCLASYVDARLHPVVRPRSFEDWVTNRFGRRLFETFFKTYTEKVWGIPTSELSADWAAQRISGLNLARVVRSALWPARGPRGQTKTAKTLIGRFRYPRLGPGQMWEEVADKLRAAGNEVLLGERVVQVGSLEGGGFEVLTVRPDGTVGRHAAAQVISTLALRDLVTMLRPEPPAEVLEAAKALSYRDFLTVCLVVRGERIFPDQWIYVHDPGVKVGRLQNFRNWSPDMAAADDTTGLGLEYFCFEGDGLWSMDDPGLVELGAEELVRLGLIRPDDVLDGLVVRQPKAYPVYDDAYADRLEMIRRWMSRALPDLQTCGRNGMHKYNNQDHSMMTGLIVARRIVGVTTQDPWLVNSDAEYLESADRLAEDRSGRRMPRRLRL